LELVGPQDQPLASWPLVPGQLKEYEAVIPDVPPGALEVRLRLTGAAAAGVSEPPVALFDNLTVE
jgi:hypothetical protein